MYTTPMSEVVTFRCSPELKQFLEEEAERRMTTKSAAAQMIVAEYARDVSQDGGTSNTPVNPPETGRGEEWDAPEVEEDGSGA